MEIVISKLKKGSIFTEEYLDLKEHNYLDLKTKNVCVLYGPNGTGKTSFSKVLKGEGSEYTVKIDGKTHTEKNLPFAHVISDQNDRNHIKGETQDFILGENIRREYDLKERINTNFTDLFEKRLNKSLKSQFGISKKNTEFDALILDKEVLSFISDIANNKSKGKGIDRSSFVEKIYKEPEIDPIELEEQKLKFFIEDFQTSKSAIRTIINYDFTLNEKDQKIVKLEEQNEAVGLLFKYSYLDDCLVCDHPIDTKVAIAKKRKQFSETSKLLDDKEKEIAEQIVKGLPLSDPFSIREKVRSAISKSDRKYIISLVTELNSYKAIYWDQLKKHVIDTVKEFNLNTDLAEYTNLIKSKPSFGTEDILFIERFLNEALERPITLERDGESNLRLLLGGKAFLNEERRNLSLSNGEQNFLSLSFELLKAKNSACQLIVLDDPISSFDSIYKNKLAYAIMSFLEGKKTLILTHNTDLIKLLEHQRQNCLNLYYFNNVVGESNGFTPINANEIKILLYIHKFLELLRDEIKDEIDNERDFALSVVPFMRGYCQILGYDKERDQLTKIMHGYLDTKINITEIYKKLFSDKVLCSNHIISAADIIKMDSNNFSPLKKKGYPLLSKALRHTSNYLYLRMKVEEVISRNFDVNTTKNYMLTQIIFDAFKGTKGDNQHHRVFFMSRKTLLNEFNHFEMDMNIFQPAIDITDKALNKEKAQILERLDTLTR
ncbi:hypothetical protein AB6D76_17825 [Vibrio splendidus]